MKSSTIAECLRRIIKDAEEQDLDVEEILNALKFIASFVEKDDASL